MILKGAELWKLSTCSVKVSLKYIEVFALYSIHKRNVDINLVEIHAEMNELLDKQVYESSA